MGKGAKIDEAEYLNAVENSLGWCTECADFTRDCTEPDAEEYDCPECDQHTVLGVENALMAGMFDFCQGAA